VAEEIQVVDLDDYTEPAETPGCYAIYLRLSREPSPAWRAQFQAEWQRIPTGFKRPAAVFGDRIRLEIHGDDMVREQLNFALSLVERTNAAMARRESAGGE